MTSICKAVLCQQTMHSAIDVFIDQDLISLQVNSKSPPILLEKQSSTQIWKWEISTICIQKTQLHPRLL